MPVESATLGLRIANALVSYVSYAAATVWPSSLAFFYPFPFDGIDGWNVAGAAAILVSATGFSLFMGKQRKYIPVGWFWYLGTLVPVIGLVQVGMQAMADRYTYLPSIGLYILLTWGARDALGGTRLGKGILRVAAAVSLLGLGVAAWIQVGYWRNDYTLAERALRVTGRNSVALNLLGKARERDGQMERAIEAHRESVRVSPNYVFGWNSLGSALFAAKRYPEALDCFREAVRLGPEYAPAWVNIGTVLRFLGRHSEALEGYREAIRRDPDSLPGWNNLGVALGDLRRYDEAGSAFREALRIDPAFAEAWSNLGVVHRAMGREPDAIAAYREALRLQPDHVKALWNLGAIASERGGREEAGAIHRRLTEIDPAEGERFFAEHIRAH
jgi:tetratricopeptide (TPR) repeat protein